MSFTRRSILAGGAAALVSALPVRAERILPADRPTGGGSRRRLGRSHGRQVRSTAGSRRRGGPDRTKDRVPLMPYQQLGDRSSSDGRRDHPFLRGTLGAARHPDPSHRSGGGRRRREVHRHRRRRGGGGPPDPESGRGIRLHGNRRLERSSRRALSCCLEPGAGNCAASRQTCRVAGRRARRADDPAKPIPVPARTRTSASA